MALARSSAYFAIGTLISRVSGLARDTIVVAILGASAMHDAFLVAFRIPNLFREMLAEGALANAFTKVYSELRVSDEAKAEDFFIKSFQFIFVLGIFISLIGFLAAPILVDAMTMFGDSSDEFRHNAIGLTRILFPFLPIMMLGSIVSGALYERGRFFLSAVAPIGFNIFYILGAVCLGPLLAAYGPQWIEKFFADRLVVGLAIGVLLGGIAQVAMNAYVLWQPLIRKTFHIADKHLWTPEIKRTFLLMAPAAIAASTGPINQLVNTNFATSLQTGAVTWLNYAFRLLQLPIGVFAVAIGVAILPSLTKDIARANRTVDYKASRTLQKGCELILWVIFPCWIFVEYNSKDVINILFGYGRFSQEDVIQTGRALHAYSMGLLAYALIKVFVSFYYAVERTGFALKIAIFSIGVNFLGNYWLVREYGHVGLAMTSSITLTFNALCLLIGLRRHHVQWAKNRLSICLVLVLAASGVGLALQHLMSRYILSGHLIGMSAKLQSLTMLVANGTMIVLVFSALGFLFFRKLKFDTSPKVEPSL